MYRLAFDDFNRADASTLGPNWTIQTNDVTWTISGNKALPALSGDNLMLYTNTVWPNDQYAQVKFSNMGTGGLVAEGQGPMVRCALGVNTYYRVVAVAALAGVDVDLGKVVAGSYTSLLQVAAHLVVGDVLKLAVFGTTLRIYANDVQIGTDVIDTAITSGYAGMAYSSTLTGTPSIQEWEGGDSSLSDHTPPQPTFRRFRPRGGRRI